MSIDPAANPATIAAVRERFGNHMRHVGNDVLLILLKGHLLVEKSMNEYLAEILPNPKPALKQDGPATFFRKIELIEMVSPFAQAHRGALIESLKALNTARNELVHYLDSKDGETKLDSFLRTQFVRAAREAVPSSQDIGLADLDDNGLARTLKHALESICVVMRIRTDIEIVRNNARMHTG